MAVSETDLPGVVSIFIGPQAAPSFAAHGQTLRLVGRNLNVLTIWFLKSPDYFGEEFSLQVLKESPGIGPHLDLFPMYPSLDYGVVPTDEEVRKQVARGLKLARESWQSREYDLIVLDEILTCCEQGLIPWEDLLQLLDTRPGYMHVTLTGTSCPETISRHAATLITFDTTRHHLDTLATRKGFDR